MLKKTLSMVLALSLAASVALAGCGQKEADVQIKDEAKAGAKADSGKKAEVVFWDENPGPSRTPYYEEMIKNFSSKNPNIEIKYVGIPTNSAKEKYDIAIAANETPDCAGVATNWVSSFVVKKALLPIDDYFAKWEEKDKIIPSYVESMRMLSPKKNLPTTVNTAKNYVLWYRTDRFKAANINPPENWDDFFKAVEKMTDKSKNQYGFSIRGGSGSDQQLMALMYSYSGITEFFDKNGKCTLGDPLMVEFIEKFTGIYKKYTPESDITNSHKEMVAAFGSGAANMIEHNIGSLDEHKKNLKPGEFAAVALPKSTKNGKRVYTASTTNGHTIFKNTKNADAAWKFVSYLWGAEAQDLWNKAIGQIPTHKDVLGKDWVKQAQHLDVLAKATAEKEYAVVDYPDYLPDYKDIRLNVAEPGFQAVLAGQKKAKAFCEEWAAAFEKSKKEYDANVNKK